MPAGTGDEGCGSMSVVATDTRNKRSSLSQASLVACWRRAPVCRPDWDMSTAFFCQMWRSVVQPVVCGGELNGVNKRFLVGFSANGRSKWFVQEVEEFICRDGVVWRRTRSCGVDAKMISASGAPMPGTPWGNSVTLLSRSNTWSTEFEWQVKQE